MQLTHTKTPVRVGAPQRRAATIAAPRTVARSTESHSNAAPLTLAAIVVLAELLAVTMAIVTAVGA